ncbi:Hypothetical protein, putative [Bodo saltans]|uniref:Uncharacterized protein n=1 Tax=Bodo saltans TaxID=75058 RepID=A0A0S4IJY8_BODSA|nr:Hypothetical protein, putative [Bodo saltans]|eukprot:CUE61217.1 Hypothetical protein, putative [Bodo saltans]
MMSSSTFANLRKAVPPKASIMAYLPNFDPNQLIHRIKLLFFVIEEHVSSVAPAAEPVVVLGTCSPKKGVAAGTTAQQPSVAIMSPNAKAGAFASLRSSSSAWGRDSFLTMSSLALHFRRQSVVDPRVFREKCKMVVALFVKYSNWASSERWQVIEERRMSPQLFASLCTVTGILQSNGQSSANIRQVASKLPSLGWQSSSSDVSVTPAVATQEYARVSPVYDLLNTTVASASADRKAAKRMVSAIQRSKKGSPQDEKAVLHVKRCLLATSRGLDASMLRPLDPTLAAMIFSVISLSRSTSAAQAQNKVFQTTGAGAPGVDRHSATVDSEGFCEEDASEVLSSDTTLGFAGFCELIAFLADQCIAHPWLSTSARTALFVEYVYSVVFE